MTLEKLIDEAGMLHWITKDSIKRVFIAREAIQNALKLDYAPEIILTGQPKDVRRVCQSRLNPASDPELAYLWDDNTEITGQYHVITVPEYFEIPENLVSKIDTQLAEMFPGMKINEATDSHLLNLLEKYNGKYSSYDRQHRTFFVRQASKPLEQWTLPSNWT
jgi:hypothetical protein